MTCGKWISKVTSRLPPGRCYPLTIVDDHSRFAVALQACARNTKDLTQAALIQTFRRYGLPARISCDNGSPWGSGWPRPITRNWPSG